MAMLPYAQNAGRAWCARHNLHGAQTDDVEADAVVCLVRLADEYNPAHNTRWESFVRARLKYRLIDEVRTRYGSEQRLAPQARAAKRAIQEIAGTDPLQLPATLTDGGYAEVDALVVLAQVVGTLDARDRQIIAARLAGQTMDQIGAHHHLTGSRIGQLLDELHPRFARALSA